MWVLGEHKINKMALSLRKTKSLPLSDKKCALFSGVGCITEKENTASKQQDDAATSKQAGYVTYLGKFTDTVVRLK